MRPTRKQLFKLTIGVILVVAMIFLYNLNRVSIQKGLIALDLIPQPEKLTELYFNNSANLPGSVVSTQVFSFSFVIHNLESTDYQYIYEVSVNPDSARHIVDRGRVLVKNNQYYVKNEQISLMNSPGSQEVVVELINIHQSIDFWVQLK